MKVFICVNLCLLKRFKWHIFYVLLVCVKVDVDRFDSISLESLEVSPKEILIPTKEINLYSLRLNCILTDHQVNRRHHEIFWWHNNRRLGSQTNRNIRIMQNLTGHSLISTLLYTGEPSTLVGNYICESEPLRRSISVVLQSNQSSSKRRTSSNRLFSSIVVDLWNDWSTILTLWIGIWLFVS